MGGTGNWDIESYRSFYESDEHWALKKEFMETHYHAMPEERLVCLAQVYANIELLGCRYPDKVMEEINYLARGIGVVYKERKKTKLQRTFVKASDAAGAKVRASKGQKRKNPNEQDTSQEPALKKMVPFVKSDNASSKPGPPGPPKFMSFVKADSAGSEKPVSTDILSFIKAVRDDNPNESDGETKLAKDDDSNEPVMVDKCMSFIKSMRGVGGREDDSSGNASGFSDPTVRTGLGFSDTSEKAGFGFSDTSETAGFGFSNSKERAGFGSVEPREKAGFSDLRDKADKYKKAVQQNIRQRITYDNEQEPADNNPAGRGIGRSNFRSPRGRASAVGGKSTDRGKYATYLETLRRSRDPLCDFILVQRVYTNCDNPVVILEQSSHFSRMPLDCSYDQNGLRCHLKINGVHVASARSDSKKSAKDVAAVKALEVLIDRCFTLRILKMHSSTDEVSLSEVAEGSKLVSSKGSSLDTPIEDSSIGNKLLKMMGWAGGGLGKDGSGISEPIKPAHVFGRTGLGHKGEQGVTKVFRAKIREMLHDYMRGTDMQDLAFSPLFSKEQRAEIHKMARQMQLKSQSHGKGENRFLVISRKFSPKQLLYRILQEGPTDKYELVPPGQS